MVKPGGTGSPARVISATPAPLPPSRSRIGALPSSKRYPHLVARRRAGAALVDERAPRVEVVRPTGADFVVVLVYLGARGFVVTGIIGPLVMAEARTDRWDHRRGGRPSPRPADRRRGGPP